jgi:hypothetical protein
LKIKNVFLLVTSFLLFTGIHQLHAQSLQIGDSIFGGRIAYFLQPGDKDYDSTKLKGFVAAPFDQSPYTTWGCDSLYIASTDSTAIGYGEANTIAIVANCSQQGIAAKLCYDLVVNGYSDWYLPSKAELHQLQIHHLILGGFLIANPLGWTNTYYWSSSQWSTSFVCPMCVPYLAWAENIINGTSAYLIKNGTNGPAVRAIRNFCVIYDTIKIGACTNYVWNGNNYLQSGLYHDTLIGTTGCDTIAVLDLSIFKKDTTTINDTFCTSKIINGQLYSSSGTYYQTLTNIHNCDSLIVLNLLVKQASTNNITTTECGSYTINGQTFTQTGQYQILLINHNGCDSTINLTLTINPIDSITFNITECDQYIFAGQTYTTGGNYIFQLQNRFGCDSIVTLNLILNHYSSATMTGTVCDSINVNGISYYATGINTQLLVNHAGCDSFLIVDIVVVHATNKTITAANCKSYTLNNQTYTATGTYTQQLINHVNCDSIVQLNLTIMDTSTFTITKTSCKSLTYNGVTYDTTGAYTQKLINHAGCDSILKLHLTIPKINTTITKSGNTLTVLTAGATYQWVNCNSNFQKIAGKTSQTFTPNSSGSYAVIVTKNGCKDTSTCFSMVVNKVESIADEAALKIYNSSLDELIIEQAGNFISKDFKLYNYIGQLLVVGKLNATITSISTKELPSGFYILKIGNRQHTFIKN